LKQRGVVGVPRGGRASLAQGSTFDRQMQPLLEIFSRATFAEREQIT
jgi:hypothetical protein